MASILQRRMVRRCSTRAEHPVHDTQLTGSQLSKEDEAAMDEVEVRREDQDKINRFSRLHQRHLALEEELNTNKVCDTVTGGPREARRQQAQETTD